MQLDPFFDKVSSLPIKLHPQESEHRKQTILRNNITCFHVIFTAVLFLLRNLILFTPPPTRPKTVYSSFKLITFPRVLLQHFRSQIEFNLLRENYSRAFFFLLDANSLLFSWQTKKFAWCFIDEVSRTKLSYRSLSPSPNSAHINLREIDFETLMLFFTFLFYFQFPTSPAFASMWFGVWYAAESCACWASCSSPSTFYCAPTPAPSAISRPCRRLCQPLWWVAALYDFYYRIYGNFGKPSKGRKKSQTQKFFYGFRRILPD